MKQVLVLVAVLLAGSLTAEPVWTLKTGPTAVPSIPLDPVQLVSAWRGQYIDGTDVIWVYATRSPQFFAPRVSEVFRVDQTPWTVAIFFPSPWKTPERRAWSDLWVKEFQTLFSLPDPGYPIVFPSILRKG